MNWGSRLRGLLGDYDFFLIKKHNKKWKDKLLNPNSYISQLSSNPLLAS